MTLLREKYTQTSLSIH